MYNNQRMVNIQLAYLHSKKNMPNARNRLTCCQHYSWLLWYKCLTPDKSGTTHSCTRDMEDPESNIMSTSLLLSCPLITAALADGSYI